MFETGLVADFWEFRCRPGDYEDVGVGVESSSMDPVPKP